MKELCITGKPHSFWTPPQETQQECKTCGLLRTTVESHSVKQSWEERFDENLLKYTTVRQSGRIKNFFSSELLRIKKELLIEILAKAESMETAREVRHLIKDYILKK